MVLALASAVAAPAIIARLPADHFVLPEVPLRTRWQQATPAGRARLLARNLLGAVLVLLGGIMLLTPGQGVLTLLAGLGLLDIPGRRALLRRLLARPTPRALLQRLRDRAKQPPLHLADHDKA